MEERLDRLESMATEQKETSEKLQKSMETVLNVILKQGEESKSDNALVAEKLSDFEKRIILSKPPA